MWYIQAEIPLLFLCLDTQGDQRLKLEAIYIMSIYDYRISNPSSLILNKL